ncbi:MAG: dTDP-4-dehydrorhamnose 3,5-epimerase [Clostridia bacterium]|nr:dTDP-4-dehydrorhamnose 3,5-epimerase [Clostridia bacterium]
MDFIRTEIDGCFEVLPKVFGDSRGWFYESYSEKAFEENGINIDFVQDNRSFSAKKGTLRGLHCQKEPYAQAKIVTCLRGEIIDVAVDIREGSPTFMKKVMVKLTGENKKMLFIPRGCLHGFVSLTDDVEISYKVDNFYEPSADRSIRFNDPEIGVEWNEENPVLSEKDKNAPFLKESDVKFKY